MLVYSNSVVSAHMTHCDQFRPVCPNAIHKAFMKDIVAYAMGEKIEMEPVHNPYIALRKQSQVASKRRWVAT